jgi:hypothetical protein
MAFIVWIIVGAIAGFLASKVLTGSGMGLVLLPDRSRYDELARGLFAFAGGPPARSWSPT